METWEWLTNCGQNADISGSAEGSWKSYKNKSHSSTVGTNFFDRCATSLAPGAPECYSDPFSSAWSTAAPCTLPDLLRAIQRGCLWHLWTGWVASLFYTRTVWPPYLFQYKGTLIFRFRVVTVCTGRNGVFSCSGQLGIILFSLQ